MSPASRALHLNRRTARVRGQRHAILSTMARTSAARQSPGFPLRAATIDVGSNAIRLLCAELPDPTSRPLVLHSERAPIRLGHSVFLSGRLAEETMEAAIAALRSFRETMTAQGVALYRAVATSAVREAKNGDAFVERVRREAGVELLVISGAEEARLVHAAVRRAVALGERRHLVADLGGGSVEVMLVDGAGILWSESHTLGSVRLLEELSRPGEEPGHLRTLLSEYVAGLRIPPAPGGAPVAGFIATGGNIESLAELAGVAPGGAGRLPLDRLRAVIESLARLPFRERVTTLGLREDRADVILPAALVYERLCVLGGCDEILVPFVGLKDGLLVDLIEEAAGKHERSDQERQTLAAATALAHRYLADEAHGQQVARLALQLFAELAEAELHTLGDRERRILLAAAVLHDIGQFVGYRGHHKHTLYLLLNSELPGFSPHEMELVANVARYHRKSEPAPRHESFARLGSDDQRTVTQLAAILRLADALDREHRQLVTALQARVQGRELELRLVGRGDLLIERWLIRRKGELFSRVFKLKLRIAD
jgi:exopolyphosphatase/guanosine-5'-triphosphate,3'-diphosphate pyrophosphatase